MPVRAPTEDENDAQPEGRPSSPQRGGQDLAGGAASPRAKPPEGGDKRHWLAPLARSRQASTPSAGDSNAPGASVVETAPDDAIFEAEVARRAWTQLLLRQDPLADPSLRDPRRYGSFSFSVGGQWHGLGMPTDGAMSERSADPYGLQACLRCFFAPEGLLERVAGGRKPPVQSRCRIQPQRGESVPQKVTVEVRA